MSVRLRHNLGHFALNGMDNQLVDRQSGATEPRRGRPGEGSPVGQSLGRGHQARTVARSPTRQPWRMASSGRTADDTGSDISAELGPVDVVQVPGGLEHGTVRRLGDVQ